jgi:hypothetical protein
MIACSASSTKTAFLIYTSSAIGRASRRSSR